MQNNNFRTAVFAIGFVALSACSTLPKAPVNALPALVYSNPSLDAINWKKILPPPPLAGSALDKIEMDLAIDANALKGSKRWDQAVSDAGLDAFIAFSPVLSSNFTKENNPEIDKIFEIILKYSFATSKAAKSVYERKRPYLANEKITPCPNALSGGSSYPSGHSALGWVNAQVLARIYPQYSDDLMARGIDYGQSRMICGVHFQSDIVAGRIVGDVLLQKLDKDEEFTKLLSIAIAKAKSKKN